MSLNTAPNLESPDDFYEALIDAHRDLSSEASAALNARLVLLLSNHIGSQQVLIEALAAARGTDAVTRTDSECQAGFGRGGIAAGAVSGRQAAGHPRRR